MILQALLVSKDDQASEALIQVLSEFRVGVVRSSAPDVAAARLSEEWFDQVIVDFEEPETASLMLESCRRLGGPDRNPPVTVALLTDASQIRSLLNVGAHFILTKPVTQQQAKPTLRAATAILKRERRQSPRIAVQAPVSIHLRDETAIECILLDLSTGGMEVLAAKPVDSSSLVHVSFDLPDCDTHIDADAEVAWSTANGQVGLRFLEMEIRIREQLTDWLRSRSCEFQSDESDTRTQCKLTDLSLGGCYVETESPFPQSSSVDLCLKVADMEIHTEGVVRIMHPSYGMGIEFPARTEEQRRSVAEFIECLASRPGAQPQLETSPRSLVASPMDLSQGEHDGRDTEDSLLELLRTGREMEQEQFQAELSRQRTPAATIE